MLIVTSQCLHDAFRCFTHPPPSLSNQGQSIAVCHITELCHRIALLNQTIPLRCPSMRHCSIALLLPALPLHPAAQLIYAMPMLSTASLCLRPSTLNQTMPLPRLAKLIPCSALQNYASALLCCVKLCRCATKLNCSDTMPIRAMPNYAITMPCI